MLVGVSLYVSRGISAYWWGYLCLLVGVSLRIHRGVSVC